MTDTGVSPDQQLFLLCKSRNEERSNNLFLLLQLRVFIFLRCAAFITHLFPSLPLVHSYPITTTAWPTADVSNNSVKCNRKNSKPHDLIFQSINIPVMSIRGETQILNRKEFWRFMEKKSQRHLSDELSTTPKSLKIGSSSILSFRSDTITNFIHTKHRALKVRNNAPHICNTVPESYVTVDCQWLSPLATTAGTVRWPWVALHFQHSLNI